MKLRTQIVHSGILCIAVMLVAGCASAMNRLTDDHHVVSRLTPRQVRQIAIERAAKNGFVTSPTDHWDVTLSVNPTGLQWTALARPQPGRGPMWIEVNDATQKAEFLAPELHLEQKFADGSDWLFKIDEALKQTKFPMELESLLRRANFAGAPCSGGGSTPDGRRYLEYTLRVDQAMPARFELRCYYQESGPSPQQKLVTGVELAYVDAQTYRYVLVRD